MRYLLVSVRFLGDRYHGLTDNGESPEWPPSPFRLFQALVAGVAAGVEIPERVGRAMEWLEELPAPVIIAPRTTAGRPLLTYVLNNVSDKDFNSRAPKMLRPTLLNCDRLLQYCWDFDATPESLAHAEVIAASARHIRALGWGIDMAIGHGQVVEGCPEVHGTRQRYEPAADASVGGLDLRTPRSGSLRSLRDQHRDFLGRYGTPGVTRLESAGAIYEPTRYVCGGGRPYVAFRLVDAEEEPAFRIRHALIAPLAGMVRGLCGQDRIKAELGRDVVDRDIDGHPQGSPNRLSIIPLPTIRDGPTDGLIRRVLLAQEPGSDGAICRKLGDVLDGKILTPLPNEQRLPGSMRLQRIERRDPVLPLYTTISRVWASVTPVLLPGYDDRKQHRGDHVKRLARAEELVRKAIGQSALPQPVSVELSRVPMFTGSLHSREYEPREKLSYYPRYHVRLTFGREITGPVIVGAGRFTGFGVCATCRED